jgi:Family of unknown function (DUF5681)
MAKPEKADYAVGYGRPPEHTRFRKGQSGNPKGRPRHARNLHTELLEELSEEIQVKEGGRTVRVTKLRALLKAAIGKAAAGDMRALALILDKAALLGSADPEASETNEAPEDTAILEAFRRRGGGGE